MRQLTIGYVNVQNRFSESVFPQLKLQGQWLEKLGWVTGVKVSVAESENEIVIRKVVENTSDIPQENQ
jgi:hypothetical protein